MSLDEYYKSYLKLHKNKNCIRMHVLGQLVTISYVIAVLIAAYVYDAKYTILLLLSPFVVYPFAWIGHLCFEKNKPAAWSKPLWAKACDWVMLWDIMRGKIKW